MSKKKRNNARRKKNWRADVDVKGNKLSITSNSSKPNTNPPGSFADSDPFRGVGNGKNEKGIRGAFRDFARNNRKKQQMNMPSKILKGAGYVVNAAGTASAKNIAALTPALVAKYQSQEAIAASKSNTPVNITLKDGSYHRDEDSSLPGNNPEDEAWLR